MVCEHCCFDCTSKGKDMSADTFERAMDLVRDDDSSCMVTIGGGEPTLHKNCLDYLWKAIRVCMPATYSAGTSVVGIVTNGSNAKQACEIAQLSEMGLCSARLSYDKFHDTSMVSDKVKYAFGIGQDKRNRRECDLRAVNSWDYFVTPHGRGLTNGIANHPMHGEKSCCCDGIFITPDGTIWQCGCREKSLGNVNNLTEFWEKYHSVYDSETGEIPCSKKVSQKA